MRNLIYTGVAAVCLLCVSAAHADTIESLTLTTTSNTGTVTVGDGTGSIDLNVAPSLTNPYEVYISTNKSGDILEGLTFTIGGDTFTLSNAASNYGLVVFDDGGLDDITYQGSSNNGEVILDFSANGIGYQFSDSGKNEDATGTISITPPSAAPEPSSLALLGTGLLAGCAVLRKRFA